MMEVKVEKLALNQFRSHLRAIAEFMDDPTVQEIMINRPGEVWIEQLGSMRRIALAEVSEVNIQAAVKALAGANHKDVQPVLDCRMPGYRIAAVLRPVGVQGPAICIRKHGAVVRSLADYLPAFEWGRAAHQAALETPPTVVAGRPETVLGYIRWLIRTKKTACVAGGTGSGKTTFLNAYISEIPADERLVTIEDTAELQVKTPNYVSLEANPSVGVDIRDLVKLSLRFRPDRIVVGEVRDKACYDLLSAMNTGHPGGATTLHANSAIHALYRLEDMARQSPETANMPLYALRQQIASTFTSVIYCKHNGATRGPEQIIEILGATDEGYETKTLFDATQPLTPSQAVQEAIS